MFTKLHKEERQLLFKTNSAVAYEVYMHLKDKYSYFKTECYDLRRCIAEYLDIPERTVKDAIKRLKKVGLITTKLKGKVNMYSFPILDRIDGKTVQVEEESSNTEQMPDNINITEETINENKEDMGTFIGYIETPIQEFEPDNFSETLNNILDEYEEIINHITTKIAEAEMSGDVVLIFQANNLKNRLKEISEKLIEDIDKTNFNKFIMEKVEIKKKYIAA